MKTETEWRDPVAYRTYNVLTVVRKCWLAPWVGCTIFCLPEKREKLLTHGITFSHSQFGWQKERESAFIGYESSVWCVLWQSLESFWKVTSPKYVPHTHLLFYVILLINYVIKIPCCQVTYCLLTFLKTNINHFNIISALLLVTVHLHNQLYMSSVCSAVSDMFRHITVAIFRESSRSPQ